MRKVSVRMAASPILLRTEIEWVRNDQLTASPATLSVWLPDDLDCAASAGHHDGNIPANPT